MSDTMTLTIEHTSQERRLLDHLAELGMRDTATILGTGANGEAAWPYIPLDSWIVGVNGAVEIPLPYPYKLHARMVFDTATPALPWYKRYAGESSCLTIFGDGLPNSTDIDGEQRDIQVDYRFSTVLGGLLANQLDPTALTSLATVGGAALDMLRHCYVEFGKPSTVYLCGLDFGGGYYFKRNAEGVRYRCNTPGTWGQKPHMDALIGDCQRRGMKMYTLSETMLEVPEWPLES